jgi:predicted enzyme related to lactoylglutathione lyase
MGAPVVHFEINAKDLKRAKEFYSSLFDWKIQDTSIMNYGMVDSGVKIGINGGIGQVDPGKPAFATFYMQVEDPQAVLDKAVSLGANVVVPVTVVPDMVTFALFSDPDGCVVGLLKGPQTMPEQKPKPRSKAVARKKKVTPTRGKARRRAKR